MSAPLVTVILPAKDAGAYIATTLATLQRQFDDPARMKVVMIDDGSTDDTGVHMRGFAQRHPHAEIIVNDEPRGLASARNQGLSRVEGEYFCFLDGDDWMQPLRLSSLAEKMANLGCDFVRTDHVTVTGRERRLVRAPYPWRGRVVSPRDGILPADESTMVDYPYAWAGMFHRRVIDAQLAHFPEGLFTAEDRPWIWRLHLQATSFAVVDAPALLYRRGVSTSLTQVLDHRQLHFIDAFAQTLEIVMADEEVDRFGPKIARTTLSLSAHHLFRSRGMSWSDRTRLRRGIRDLVAKIPVEYLVPAYEGVSQRARRLLAGSVREAVRA